MYSRTVQLADDSATRSLGNALALSYQTGGFIGLVGELGAGKTTLVQGLLATIAPEVEASSPTYTLLNVYETSPPVYHFDLYRLENADDLESVGYWDHIEDYSAISCVEWLDRVESAWPGHGIMVRLEHVNDTRKATLEGVKSDVERVLGYLTK